MYADAIGISLIRGSTLTKYSSEISVFENISQFHSCINISIYIKNNDIIDILLLILHKMGKYIIGTLIF